MVKPLNKEWELFGRKYRVAGAKGEKVDCNACQKQVSAAVNRLQSHMRVCPARPAPSHSHTVAATTDDLDGTSSHSALTVDSAIASDVADASVGTVGMLASTVATAPADTTLLPAAKRPRTTPTIADRARWPLVAAAATADDVCTPTPSAYFKRRIEIEEQRLQLELKREHRELARERFQLEILEAQARKEKSAAAKETYEARVLLTLSRKQLRDQGVCEDEIDRILPVDPQPESPAVAATVADSAAADQSGHAAAAAANAAASAALEAAKLDSTAVL